MKIQAMALLAAVTVVSGLSAVVAAPSVNMQAPKSYTAEYEVISAGSKIIGSVIADGRGHLRLEKHGPGQEPQVAIVDRHKGQITVISKDERSAQVFSVALAQLPVEALTQANLDADKSLKSIGMKTIDGHLCHGYKSDNGKDYDVTWIGEDTGCVVLWETSSGDSTHLKSFSAGKTSSIAFVVPDQY